MVIMIMLFYILCVYIEFKYYIKKEGRKEMLIYGVLMGSQLILSFLIFFEIELTTPIEWIENIVRSIKG